jgi:RNA polymerase sigma-B factor
MLAPALRSLTERERLIVRLRFVEDLTQEEIGERIGVTQMQVSRLLKKVMAKLREQLGVGEDFAATA